ncbi:transcriptional regulator [Burkholderia cenocepacia]|uniref:Mor transcription activator family protein n=1 Tax=Burkholderia cenocepacia TaxID=95486 RepID=UPI001AA17754|nr:Mor transcription activator family protein [Burkholderia cenocepacia]MBO1856820.1 transcriptional regulator [Burkholderia cenocepacia]
MNPIDPMRFPPDYPEVLEYIGQLVYRDLCVRGVHPRIAIELALQVGESLAVEFGGTQPYIPRSLPHKLSERDRQIYREFRGDNYAQLARKHGLSEVQIRKIVQRGIDADRRDRQSPLF